MEETIETLPETGGDRKRARRKVVKLLLVLAIPIALQNLLSALLNIVDSVMVQKLGEVEMSAVLLVNQLIFIFQVICFATAGAGVVFVSQFWGSGEQKKIPPCTGISLAVVLFFAVLFTVFSALIPEKLLGIFSDDAAIIAEGAKFLKVAAWSFLPFGITTVIGICLRGMKKVTASLIIAAVAVLVNVFLDYTFMFGKLGFPNLAIAGAAIGTVIARFIEMAALVVFVLLRKYPIFASPGKMFRWNGKFLKEYFLLFLPACANEVFWVLGTSVYLYVFSHLPGNILPAVNITQSIDKLIFVALIGVGNAAGVVVGNAIGAGDSAGAKYSSKLSLVFSVLTGVAIALIMAACVFVVPLLFDNVSPDNILHAQWLIGIFALFMPIRALTFTLIVGVLRAGGDTLFCALCETITVWVIAVPIACITGLVAKLPIEIVYLCIYIEEVVKMFIVLHRFRSGKWMRNLVRGLS